MKKLSSLFSIVAAMALFCAQADDDDDLMAALDDSPSPTQADAASNEGGSDEGGSDEGGSDEGGSDEGGSDEGSSDESSADADDAAGAEQNIDVGIPGLQKKPKEKFYHTLPYCRRLEGKAEVLRPGASQWTEIQEGKYYALGTLYRTVPTVTEPKPFLRVDFGGEIRVEIKGEATFGTRAQPLGGTTRTITLISGTITVKLPRNLPEGLFIVSAPGFMSVNPQGDAKYTYRKTVDGDEAKVRCVTGRLCLQGMHFKIPEMKAANEVRIVTSQDLLFTGLFGSRGDYIVRLDQGRIKRKDFETGGDIEEEKTLDWKLSPETAVRIHRQRPALGERIAVTTMTFDATGELKNRCAFTEHMIEVNSGELGPTSKKDREAIAKRAAEATETLAGDATTTEEAEPEQAANDEASTEEASSSGDSAAEDDFQF